MTCDRFDPITGSVASCCVVCSHRGACEKENAALVLEHKDGKSRTTTNDSTAIIADLGRKCNG